MTILAEDEVERIARAAAAANNLSIYTVSTAPAFTDAPAIEIKVVVTAGSSASIMGGPSARTTSRIVRDLADRGEERLPIVSYDEAQRAP
jgi:hypothetical protein